MSGPMTGFTLFLHILQPTEEALKTASRVETITWLIVIFYTPIKERVCVVVTTPANTSSENQGNSSVFVQHGLEGGSEAPLAERDGRHGVFPSKEN